MLAAHTARIGKSVAAAPTPVGSVTKPAKPRKYGNVPTTDAEGVKHASKKQAARYRDLGLLMKSGEILMLAREVRFRLPSARSRPVIAGAFGKSPEVCKQILEAV